MGSVDCRLRDVSGRVSGEAESFGNKLARALISHDGSGEVSDLGSPGRALEGLAGRSFLAVDRVLPSRVPRALEQRWEGLLSPVTCNESIFVIGRFSGVCVAASLSLAVAMTVLIVFTLVHPMDAGLLGTFFTTGAGLVGAGGGEAGIGECASERTLIVERLMVNAPVNPAPLD